MSKISKPPLLILGVYPESEGYPNIKYRLHDLLEAHAFNVSILHVPIWAHNIVTPNKWSALTQAWRFVRAHGYVFYQYIQHPYKQSAYIPYPAIFTALLLSWLPRRLQPKHLVIDAFISLYDTIVLDRQLFRDSHPIAKMLYAIERRAFQNSSLVIVDTEQNAQYLGTLFHLPSHHFKAIPLSTDETALSTPPYTLVRNKTVFNVLFIGTLIPLHGIDIILGAIKQLTPRHNIHFTIIGSGQMSPLITEFMAAHKTNLTWIKDWYSPAQLLHTVTAADICLGIFGLAPKTQRVYPLKLYLYSACGRAVISADTPCLRELLPSTQAPAIKLVPAGSASALAAAIEELVEEPELIEKYAHSARRFYLQTLTNQAALEQLITALNA